MGFWDRFRGISSVDPAQRVLPEPYEAFVSTAGIPVMDPGSPLELWVGHRRSQVESFWRTQPNLRKVVDYIARNVSSIPLNAFERVSDTERVRLSGEALPDLLRSPQPRLSPYRFWHGVLSDGLLYDKWAVLIVTEAGRQQLVHIPSWRLRFDVDPLRRVTGVRYWVGDDERREAKDEWVDLPLDDLIFDHGYAPRTAGLSPVDTLRDILDENREAVQYRRELWENGPRTPGYIRRPAEAPSWTDSQRNRFLSGMRSYKRGGKNAGGIPLMEDGMTIESTSIFTPQDARDIEGRELTGIETAAAFHIAPELVGAREGTFSNIDAFRQMTYGPSLGPYVDAWQGALNAQLTPRFAKGRSVYVEANIESKLRGSFIEQASIMQSATGAPWMTRNEARAMQNRAPIAGGDSLVVPLNVLEGGQASPTDSGSQNRASGPRPGVKAAPTEPEREKAAQVLSTFFKRQRKAVLSALGAKAAGDWWDAERWDRELSADLLALSVSVVERAAKRALSSAGGEPDDFDSDRTINYLKAKATATAEAMNATTKAQLDDAIDDDDLDPADVFDAAEGERSSNAGLTLTTSLAAFGTVEAAKQTGGATKTWITGANARPSHAAMDGETVAISDDFSNGMAWPGDSSDADAVAGCNCSVAFNY